MVLAGCAGSVGEVTTLPESPSAEAATAPPPATELRRISASEARMIMGDEGDFIILDVRTRAEFEEAHIEGALLISVNDIIALAPDLLQNREQIILVYCRSGQRSRDAALTLIDMGYTAVYDFGGIIDWPYGTVS